jgi:transcriptional regulator with PAS, ATPase and Fis domain
MQFDGRPMAHEISPLLPLDPHSALKLAAKSMFDVFEQLAMGMMVVDRDHRIVWISEGYKLFLPGLGFSGPDDFVGRPVEDVVPNTLMGSVIESGRPVLVDLLTNQAGTFLVSRLPLRDDEGRVIGAIGMVLLDHPGANMQPLMTKFTRLQRELDDARKQLAVQRRPRYTIASFIGSSPAAVGLKSMALRVAGTDSTVLLLGETGSGKEVLAQAIHAASSRSGGPFIGINIAAVPESLLEAEFFGVAPGAYTGAGTKARDGKFKMASSGTLFLDEVGDMPLPLQAKLLRVLQEQEVEPLGANEVVRVDVRVIAATSRDLPAMVAAGEFRADLFYRLNVLPIRLPALRERLSDLPALADALLADIARCSGMPVRMLTPDALELLAGQRWPGNVRELRNVLEQASVMTDDLQLTPAHLAHVLPGRAVSIHPLRLAADEGEALAPLASTASTIRPLPDLMAELERNAIGAALRATAGNRVAAAKLLRISRATLYEKLVLYPELRNAGAIPR